MSSTGVGSQQKALLLAGFPASVGTALGKALTALGFDLCSVLDPSRVAGAVTCPQLAEALLKARQQTFPPRAGGPRPAYLLGWSLQGKDRSFDGYLAALWLRYSTPAPGSGGSPGVHDPFPIVLFRRPARAGEDASIASDPQAQIYVAPELLLPPLMEILVKASPLGGADECQASTSARFFVDRALAHLDGVAAHELRHVFDRLQKALDDGDSNAMQVNLAELRARLKQIPVLQSDYPTLAAVAAEVVPANRQTHERVIAELEQLLKTSYNCREPHSEGNNGHE